MHLILQLYSMCDIDAVSSINKRAANYGECQDRPQWTENEEDKERKWYKSQPDLREQKHLPQKYCVETFQVVAAKKKQHFITCARIGGIGNSLKFVMHTMYKASISSMMAEIQRMLTLAINASSSCW